MNTILLDLRYSLRTLLKTPTFTVAAVLSLAIGIGATAAVFSIANALLLRPLPYQDPDRLVILWNRSPGLGITEDWFSTAQYFDIKTGHRGLEQVAIAIGGNYNLTGKGEPERVGTIRVSSNLLPMLGMHAEIGRLFVADEDQPGRNPTALLSYGTWTRRYGSDPGIVGKTITLNGMPYEVVGVMPRSFALPREVMPTLDGAEQAEVLLPLPLPADAAQNRDHEDYNIVGKLRPGVSLKQAQAEMDTITARLRHDHPQLYPPNGGLTFGIVPLMEQVVGDVRRTLYLLLGSGWLRAADCLRECGQPPVIADGGAAEGDRSALRAGRQPSSHHPPTADGEPAAGAGRRRSRFAVGLCERALDPRPRAAERAADKRRRHRRNGAAVHVHHLGRVGGAVRHGARGTRLGNRCAEHAAGHQPDLGRRRRRLGTRTQSSPSAGGCRTGAVHHAADRLGAAGPQFSARAETCRRDSIRAMF